MKLLRVTYRAVFTGPIGKLNPMGLKISGQFPVEVFGSGENWRAREIQTSKRQVYEKIGKWLSRGGCCKGVEECFQSQVAAWQMWAAPPDKPIEPRQLSPDEIIILNPTTKPDPQVYWKEAEDFTHIIHAPAIPPKAKIPPAACGAQVKAGAFINNKANVEPTCKVCAQVWREHYMEQPA